MARNVGARGVTTDWILFVDSDCYVDAAGFERAWTVLGAPPYRSWRQRGLHRWAVKLLAMNAALLSIPVSP